MGLRLPRNPGAAPLPGDKYFGNLFRLAASNPNTMLLVYEETSEILGLKPETVKTRLHRARTMLRDNVEKKIGPVVMEAFPFAGKRCERLTDAVLKRLGFA